MAAWNTPETRCVVMIDGSTRRLTYPFLVWQGYDELLDAGYPHELLIELAGKAGWDPPDLPFEQRLNAVIADTHNRWSRLGRNRLP